LYPCHLLHLPLRRALGSAFLPYTTLFRSEFVTGDDVEDRGAGRACRFPVVAEALRARFRVEDERRTVVSGLRMFGPTVGDDLAGLGLVGGGGEAGEEAGLLDLDLGLDAGGDRPVRHARHCSRICSTMRPQARTSCAAGPSSAKG